MCTNARVNRYCNFQFAQSSLTAPGLLGVHRRGTFRSGQIRQPPVTEHKAGEKLPTSIDTQVAGQVYRRQRV